MIASRLIDILRDLINKQGDIKVGIYDESWESYRPIKDVCPVSSAYGDDADLGNDFFAIH